MRWKTLSTRAETWPLLVVISLLLLPGILFWGGFNWALELTNTESFCISCHEMEANVYREYRNTVHYQNRTGVRATCPDCHVPRDWIHKVARKVGATNELFHWMIGSIDTREKFQNKREELARHVWKTMQETDSRECRNCHANAFMSLDKQTLMAGRTHELGRQWRMTCIDCHQGISHQLPEGVDREARIDGLHHHIKQQQVQCFECHEDAFKTPVDEEW